jgi:hypothetical protein
MGSLLVTMAQAGRVARAPIPLVASKASDPLKIRFRAQGIMTSFPDNP